MLVASHPKDKPFRLHYVAALLALLTALAVGELFSCKASRVVQRS